MALDLGHHLEMWFLFLPSSVHFLCSSFALLFWNIEIFKEFLEFLLFIFNGYSRSYNNTSLIFYSLVLILYLFK